MSQPLIDEFHCEFRVNEEIVTVTVEARNTWDARKAAWNDLRDTLSETDFDRAVLRQCSRVRIGPPINLNYAENQGEWDKGNASLRECYDKGAEHREYGWSSSLGFPTNDYQQEAYRAGRLGEPFPF
jgi:hypothetical protein